VYPACFYSAPINSASANTLRAVLIPARVAPRQQFQTIYYQTVSMDRILAPLLQALPMFGRKVDKKLPDLVGAPKLATILLGLFLTRPARASSR
jgi:hypothetical protein